MRTRADRKVTLMSRGRGGRRGRHSGPCTGRYPCDNCWTRTQQAVNEDNAGSNWSEPMGGGDSEGNPLTVSFGRGPAEGHTLLGDGDRSEENFLDSSRHDHYGSGDGAHNNGSRRGQYTGEGH